MKRKGDARSKNKNGKSYNGKLLLDTNNHIILINCSLTLAPFRYHFQHLPFRINIKLFSFSVRLVRLRSFHLHSVQFDTVLVFFNVYAQWTFHLLGKFVFFSLASFPFVSVLLHTQRENLCDAGATFFSFSFFLCVLCGLFLLCARNCRLHWEFHLLLLLLSEVCITFVYFWTNDTELSHRKCTQIW